MPISRPQLGCMLVSENYVLYKIVTLNTKHRNHSTQLHSTPNSALALPLLPLMPSAEDVTLSDSDRGGQKHNAERDNTERKSKHGHVPIQLGQKRGESTERLSKHGYLQGRKAKPRESTERLSKHGHLPGRKAKGMESTERLSKHGYFPGLKAKPMESTERLSKHGYPGGGARGGQSSQRLSKHGYGAKRTKSSQRLSKHGYGGGPKGSPSKDRLTKRGSIPAVGGAVGVRASNQAVGSPSNQAVGSPSNQVLGVKQSATAVGSRPSNVIVAGKDPATDRLTKYGGGQRGSIPSAGDSLPSPINKVTNTPTSVAPYTTIREKESVASVDGGGLTTSRRPSMRSALKSFRGGPAQSRRGGTASRREAGSRRRDNIIIVGQQRNKEGSKMPMIMLIVGCVVVLVIILVIAVVLGVVLRKKKGSKQDINVNTANSNISISSNSGANPVLGMGLEPFGQQPIPKFTKPPAKPPAKSPHFAVESSDWCGKVPSCPPGGRCTDRLNGRRYFVKSLRSIPKSAFSREAGAASSNWSTFGAVEHYCKRIGGRVPEPRNAEDYRNIVRFAKSLGYKPTFPLDGFYLGFTDPDGDGTFTSIQTGAVLTLSGMPRRVPGQSIKMCSVGLLREDGWADWKCDDVKKLKVYRVSVLACEFECN